MKGCFSFSHAEMKCLAHALHGLAGNYAAEFRLPRNSFRPLTSDGIPGNSAEGNLGALESQVNRLMNIVMTGKFIFKQPEIQGNPTENFSEVPSASKLKIYITN